MALKEYIGVTRLTQAFTLLKTIFDTKVDQSDLTDLLTETIAAGNTSCTISDASIATTSIIDIYFENRVLSPTSVTVANGSVTIGIDAQESAVTVGIRVLNPSS